MEELLEENSSSNKFAKVCMAQALIQLMSKKEIDKISITDIAEKAGVSRMTYYRNFTSKQGILEDYMDNLVKKYIKDVESQNNSGKYHHYIHILECFRFFKEYSQFGLCLIRANLSSILLNGLNNYMETYIANHNENFIQKCNMYYYAGALYNIYLEWLKTGMKESEETIAKLVYRLAQTPSV